MARADRGLHHPIRIGLNCAGDDKLTCAAALDAYVREAIT
jgi:hypothetical protein